MTGQLFPEDAEKAEEISIPDGKLRLYRRFFSPEESDNFFTELKNTVEWEQEKIKRNKQLQA